ECRYLPDRLFIRQRRDVLSKPRIVGNRLDDQAIAAAARDGVEDRERVSTGIGVAELFVGEVLLGSVERSLAGQAANGVHRVSGYGPAPGADRYHELVLGIAVEELVICQLLGRVGIEERRGAQDVAVCLGLDVVEGLAEQP